MLQLLKVNKVVFVSLKIHRIDTKLLFLHLFPSSNLKSKKWIRQYGDKNII